MIKIIWGTPGSRYEMTLETQRKNIMANLESQKLANEFLFCKFTREEAQQIVDEAIKLAYPEESDSSQA